MIWDQLSLQIAFLLAYMLRNGLSNPYSHLIYCNVAFILVVIDAGVLLLFESLKNVLKRGYYQEFAIRPHRTFLARTADGKFHRHDRQTEDEQEQHITHDERAAAVLTDHPRELPYVAHADGAACGKQDEAET